jgi:hypothetical protein
MTVVLWRVAAFFSFPFSSGGGFFWWLIFIDENGKGREEFDAVVRLEIDLG